MQGQCTVGPGPKRFMGHGNKRLAMIRRGEVTHEQKVFPDGVASFMGGMNEGHYYLGVGTGGLGAYQSSKKVRITGAVWPFFSPQDGTNDQEALLYVCHCLWCPFKEATHNFQITAVWSTSKHNTV